MRTPARAARRHTVLGLIVLAAVGLAGWISTVAINGLPWSSPYELRLALPGRREIIALAAEL